MLLRRVAPSRLRFCAITACPVFRMICCAEHGIAPMSEAQSTKASNAAGTAEMVLEGGIMEDMGDCFTFSSFGPSRRAAFWLHRPRWCRRFFVADHLPIGIDRLLVLAQLLEGVRALDIRLRHPASDTSGKQRTRAGSSRSLWRSPRASLSMSPSAQIASAVASPRHSFVLMICSKSLIASSILPSAASALALPIVASLIR